MSVTLPFVAGLEPLFAGRGVGTRAPERDGRERILR